MRLPAMLTTGVFLALETVWRMASPFACAMVPSQLLLLPLLPHQQREGHNVEAMHPTWPLRLMTAADSC
jgi:hypothetical protein